MTIRKTSQKIREKIISALNDQPLSVEQLRKNIKDSNWSTINNHLEELEKEGKVKALVSTDKIKLYKKVTGDTYFDIPITEEERKMFKFIFSTLIKKYKDKEKIPRKTELAKAVVDVINEAHLDLPVVWYLYGQIPLMVCDPQKDYTTSFIPNNKSKILEISSKVISNQEQKNTRELRKQHYEKYDNDLYKIKEDLIYELNKNNNNKQKILDLFNNFYLACPINNDEDLFLFTDRLCVVVRKLNFLLLLDEQRMNIGIALDNLWKYIAMYQLLDSLNKYTRYKKDEITKFYIKSIIETKQNLANEAIQNLESVYFENLPSFDPESIKLSKETLEIRKIMEDWTGED